MTVVCGPLELDPTDPTGNTVLNPHLTVEVLSPSTERLQPLGVDLSLAEAYARIAFPPPRVRTTLTLDTDAL